MAQTNTVYDPDSDERVPHNAADVENLNDLTGISPDEERAMDERARSDNDPESSDDLDSREKSAGEDGASSEETQNASGGDTKKNKDEPDAQNDKDKLGKGFTGGSGEKQGALSKFKGSSSTKKWVIAGVAGSGGGFVVVLVILLLIASSLKIPDLAQHITNYEFARVTRQFAESAQRATSEKLVLDAANDGSKNGLYSAMKDRYANATGKVKDTWALLDNYRPSKVIDTLGAKNGLELVYDNRGRFIGGVLEGTSYTLERPGASRFVPGLNKVMKFKGQLQFSRDFVPALQDSLKTTDAGPLVRGVTAREIRQRLGIGLLAWNLAKFMGTDPEQARLEQARQAEKKVSNNLTPDEPATEVLQEGGDAGKTVETDTINSNTKLEQAIKNGGIVKDAQAAIDSALADSGLKTVLSWANPIYGVAMPICIVYDGSIDSAQGSINNNTQQQQAAYYYIASAADQQKQGTSNTTDAQNLAKAVNATNDDLGDISQSNPEIIASGGTVNTLASNVSAEAGASGEYTLLNAIPGISKFADQLNGGADNFCKIFTNTQLGIAIGVANVAAAFLSFGGSEVTEEGMSQAASALLKQAAKDTADRLVSRIIGDSAVSTISQSSRVVKMLYGTGKDTLANAIGIAGATVIAKLIVLNKAGMINSGLAQGKDLANIASSGGNIQAGELSREQEFGRPLNNTEVAASDNIDTQFIVSQNSSKSFTDRYFATSNASSLLSRLALGVSANFNGGFMAGVLKVGSSVLSPLKYIGSLALKLDGRALAAPDPSTQHYGNVQFGWSEDEEALIDSSGSYQPLENQAVLDASGREIAIANTYANCFGYTSDGQGNISPETTNDGDSSLGKLLSSGEIVRDSNGNVLNQGLCSPSNLSYNSPDPNAVDNDPDSPKTHDLVFRWRLAMQYNTTINQMIGLQSVSN